ncbi:MAG: hypothetical protein PHY43_14740 [Verrucomicrobiales bacterium]|nr:hypothetical protein [Verrucomicrobiales bacterium]
MYNAATNRSNKPVVERYFYSAATVLLLGLTVVGFQLFYFHAQMYPGRPLTPPIKTLIITHGVAMSLWMLLAIMQPLLVAGGSRRVHMALGKVAAVIAVFLVVLGLKLGIASCQVAPPELMYGPLTPKQFLSVPVGDIALFALFVAAGVSWRKRPDIHRPMMFLASLTAVAAAISRMDFLNHLYAGTVWEKLFGFFFFALVIGGVFLIAKCVVFRKFDRWFAAGFGVMAVWFLMVTQGATTPVWDAIASFLLR